MDWSRAKTILIITFLVLDIFLAAQINHTIEEKSLFVQTGNISNQQLQKSLKDNRVRMKVKPQNITEVSPYTAVISPFSNDWVQDETGAYTKYFKKPVKIKDTDTLKNFLKKEIPYFSSYNKVLETSRKTIFLQQENNFPLFDGKLEIHFAKNHKIHSIRILHFKTTKIKKINLISFNNALYNLLYSDELSQFKTPTITNAIFGYRARSNPTTSSDYYLMPYWRFVINEKSHIDVNALSGIIEKPENE